ncbi:hypothetical protein GWK47_011884 [Chionoecetes opilio]|uniref:Uncharacterized protein n=1 Tax=Chionoecetes opilio TaxID=41210 RepID=A0A8J5CMS3_CHIOP|nr:hypothetical protein GWK47_011884 [Chionoecetes opilio]
MDEAWSAQDLPRDPPPASSPHRRPPSVGLQRVHMTPLSSCRGQSVDMEGLTDPSPAGDSWHWVTHPGTDTFYDSRWDKKPQHKADKNSSKNRVEYSKEIIAKLYLNESLLVGTLCVSPAGRTRWTTGRESCGPSWRGLGVEGHEGH